MVDRDGPADAKGAEPGADIARHLDRHGVEVELRHVPDWDRTSDALLNEVRQLNADLVVVGAYGHSRFCEWIIGGVTRRFLTLCPAPMLMAH
jgi:nucleotide-binding universal stress UspA family protein